MATIIVAAMLIPFCSIAAGYCPRMGDVNGDNKVNAYDAVVLLRSSIFRSYKRIVFGVCDALFDYT